MAHNNLNGKKAISQLVREAAARHYRLRQALKAGPLIGRDVLRQMPYEALVPTLSLGKYWEAVQPGEIPGLDNPIRGDCQLVVRPISVQRKAEEHRQREAVGRLRQHEQGLLSGNLPNVRLDSTHPSATGSNKIKHGYERIAVPRDE